MWEAIGFSGLVASRDPRALLLKHFSVTGASLSFRSRYLYLLLPIPKGWMHDAWIALLMSNVSDLSAIEEPMFAYRQHGTNQCGAPRRKRANKHLLRRVDKYALHAQLYNEALLRLNKFPGDIQNIDFKIKCLKEKVDFLYFRCRIPNKRIRRIPLCLYGLVSFRYHRYGRGWKHFIRDLIT